MLQLKEQLTAVCFRHNGERFVYLSLGRFDQQETTRFHLDGAPDRSLLMLGYEPSPVASCLFLADYTRRAFELGITPKQFLVDHNPAFGHGEQELAGHITAIRLGHLLHSQVLLINNGSLPFMPNRVNPLGVLHKAEILNPNSGERRIVNSIMLATDACGENAVGSADQQEFVRSKGISPKVM
jgi:hypothetical protein